VFSLEGSQGERGDAERECPRDPSREKTHDPLRECS